jgi:hypothetical protein
MSSEPDWLTNLIDSVPQGRNPSVELLRKSRQLQKKFGKGYREPELISPSERRAMEALHRLKLGRPLQEKLRRADTKGDWVLVNSRFADLYMTALAGIFAKKKMFQL